MKKTSDVSDHRYALCTIFAVPRTALSWRDISDVIPGIYWSSSLSLGITGTTVAFTFPICSSCSGSSLGISQATHVHSSWCCYRLILLNIYGYNRYRDILIACLQTTAWITLPLQINLHFEEAACSSQIHVGQAYTSTFSPIWIH